MTNVYMSNGKHMISKVLARPDKTLKEQAKKTVDIIGGFEKFISKGDTVLIKPNFNSDDLYPASSDPDFVGAVAELSREAGAKEVKIIESSGFPWLQTQKVFDRTGMTRVAKELDIELIPLDDTEVIEVNIEGGREITGAMMYQAPFEKNVKQIWLPCMKTHNYARFSLSLKLVVGFLDVRKRGWLHTDPEALGIKIAELNKPITPDLIIMDARKAFASGGPTGGHVVKPNSMYASGDRIAMDIEGLKVLSSYPDDNFLTKKIWEYDQIKRATELGLGAKNDSEIEFV
jgi:uncharacterized protein (DUF362 family)